MSVDRILFLAVGFLVLVSLLTWFDASAGSNGSAADAGSGLAAEKFQIQVGVAQQGDQLVIAVVDSETGRVRSCWIRGRADKPECSQWSD